MMPCSSRISSTMPVGLPPSMMSTPRPAMFVAMVTAPGRPACAMICASCSWYFAFNTLCGTPRCKQAGQAVEIGDQVDDLRQLSPHFADRWPARASPQTSISLDKPFDADIFQPLEADDLRQTARFAAGELPPSFTLSCRALISSSRVADALQSLLHLANFFRLHQAQRFLVRVEFQLVQRVLQVVALALRYRQSAVSAWRQNSSCCRSFKLAQFQDMRGAGSRPGQTPAANRLSGVRSRVRTLRWNAYRPAPVAVGFRIAESRRSSRVVWLLRSYRPRPEDRVRATGRCVGMTAAGRP